MASKEPVLKRRRQLQRGLLAATALVVIGSGISCLYLQHIPGWYQPLWLSQVEIDTAQDKLEQIFEAISQQMVEGEEFSVAFTTRQLNEMLSVQQVAWPAATDWMDPHMKTPCIAISRDRLALGLRYQWGNIQSILSLDLKPRVCGEQLNIDIQALRAGSMLLPKALITNKLANPDNPQETSKRSLKTGSSYDTVLKNIAQQLQIDENSLVIENLFDWPNGEIPFAVTALTLDDDSITLHILPKLN